MAVHNCSECDYCYSNETFRDDEHICVNGESEYVGEFIDGYAEEDYDCVVIDGKHRWEIDEDEELEEKENEEDF